MDGTGITLAEEVLLLSLDDEKGSRREQQRADFALAGAVLMELALAGRVGVMDDRVVVLDAAATGDPAQDRALARISGSSKPRKPKHWVDKLRRDALDGARQGLVAKGVLRKERRSILGVFPVRRYPEADGRAEAEVRQRLERVVFHGERPDPRTSALAAVLHGAGLYRLAFPDADRRDRKEAKQRLEQLAEETDAWAAPAVHKAIKSMEAAMIGAVVAASSAGASGS